MIFFYYKYEIYIYILYCIMCYSASASLGSFLISLVGFLYLYYRNKRNDRMLGFLVLGISIMQIGELLIHLDIDCKTGLNKIGSILGMFSHSIIQPAFALGAIILFCKKKLNDELLLFWFLLIITSVISNIFYWPQKGDLCSYKHECVDQSKGCQLYWPWYTSINVPLYAALVFILPIIFSDLEHKIMWIIYVLLGPIIFTYLYPKTASSVWCFLGPVLTILLKILVV